MTRINRTTLSDREFGERLVASFARAATRSQCPFIAAFYARECVRIARQFLCLAS